MAQCHNSVDSPSDIPRVKKKKIIPVHTRCHYLVRPTSFATVHTIIITLLSSPYDIILNDYCTPPWTLRDSNDNNNILNHSVKIGSTAQSCLEKCLLSRSNGHRDERAADTQCSRRHYIYYYRRGSSRGLERFSHDNFKGPSRINGQKKIIKINSAALFNDKHPIVIFYSRFIKYETSS